MNEIETKKYRNSMKPKLILQKDQPTLQTFNQIDKKKKKTQITKIRSVSETLLLILQK